ncbi:PDZ domain-containing protein [Snuella sp. CAU 1569]|uniref:PDZ domain-containing protein n=1 Tax=Snuella sedimenti TaxID=2798802 RepID=A0A8J7J2Z5_9FLAO|nr:PDZ domain-containing protein [Snuella sedimenti]
MVGISFILCIQMLLGCKPQVLDIYVNPNGNNAASGFKDGPLATIASALAKAEAHKETYPEAHVNIYLQEGEYHLVKPIVITSQLSHLNIIGEGSDKVIIKGSEQLDLNWVKQSDSIWIAEVKGHLNFDQFFVNGQQQILARYPNYSEEGGHWQGHAVDAISLERVKSWKQPKGAIVHAMHSGEWGDFHYRISKANEDGTVDLTGGHQNNRPSKMHERFRMVENVLEELDSPGEWYFDKDTKQLYYWPSENVNVETAVFEGAILKNLISIQGTEPEPVQDINIKGIKFTHTQRTFMEDYEPLLRSDWTIYRGGALFIEGTEKVSITDCEFVNLGGNVIFASNYNRDITIERNHIHDCGATAISFVGDPKAVRSPSFQYGEYVNLAEMDTIPGPATNNYPSKSVVNDNLIYRIGRIEKQTAGVQLSMAMDITISNNSIYDIPRAGINVSEGTWGGHVIEFNDVFNTVLETSDHGAFNSWGRDRFWHPNRSVMNELTTNNPQMPYWDAIHTTIIRNNRFRCDHGWDIDLDDGSSNYTIYNNLCLNGGIKLREGFYRTVENNIMVNNGFHPHVWFKNSGDIFRKNIVFTSHRDIRLLAWGKEVDYNFFPNESSLKEAQTKGVDAHSIFGDIEFKDPTRGNYDLVDTTEVSKIGFKPFRTDVFGVKTQKLKALAKNPDFPEVYLSTSKKKGKVIVWQYANIKNIETIEERSASGLNKTAGVLVVSLNEKSILKKSGIQEGDVIIRVEGTEIENVSDLINNFQKLNWKGKMKLGIFRNQKEQAVNLITK